MSSSEGESSSSAERTTEASETSSGGKVQAAGQGNSNLIAAASAENCAGKTTVYVGWPLFVGAVGVCALL